ncbi:regulator of chromosome condensation domain-containing protein [Heterostelium album PN500]|uniref:Regulator of chromosome condensation domain-containing protein n=1 Tax=Heterostelium pallidum (strain ATCC 26659 / Pp 5 / PN500) TaxID=670386 RepID=D3B1Y7_HETP5|nr:regulator of chromosome condensation domain-containing protein [Heterostelium album PN500]EFA85311.1 regulator of chromosome condensation domain-containing protein [Heterostelium album PN500]|eukprot:XP_020437420.1 regulator of chromosome condensation domain-containing protein [Heterostelium album PN500]
MIKKYLYCWGVSYSGQLGLGSAITSQYQPKKLKDLTINADYRHYPKQIKTGSYHTLLTYNSQLYVWGDHKQGQLGLGGGSSNSLVGRYDDHHHSQFTPVLHPFFDRSKFEIKSIGCGGYHSIDTYETYAFGRNNEGQLGIGSAQFTSILEPTLIPDLTGVQIKHISCGPNYTVLVTNDNIVYSFGMNDFGQCGQKVDSATGGRVTKPTVIKELSGINGVDKVTSGWGHTLMVTNNGDSLITWGSNFHGQCGVGTKGKDPITVQQVKLINGNSNNNSKIIDISCGSAASIAVVNDNGGSNTLIWGSCGDGKLGGNQTEDLKSPTPMDNLPNTINKVAFGTDHCLASTTDNRLFGWGFGQHGALGVGSTRDQLKVYKTPIEIKSELNNYAIDDIESSIDTSFAIVSDISI